MNIIVNGKPRQVPADKTLLDLLADLELNPATLVVEHNRALLARERFGEVVLCEGDALELVRFVGGG